MSDKLKEIFDGHYDKTLSFSFHKTDVHEKLMSRDKFVDIVTKIVKQTSTGKKIETIEDLHKYLGVGGE